MGYTASGCHVAITHGNGPQLGAQLLRSEQASDQVPAQTLDVCGVASQGEIGYLLSQSWQAELFAAGLKAPVVSAVTQTVVRPDDPAIALRLTTSRLRTPSASSEVIPTLSWFAIRRLEGCSARL
jgi:carbamate kinase